MRRFIILLRDLDILRDGLKRRDGKRAETGVSLVRSTTSLLEMGGCLSEDTLKKLREAMDVIEGRVKRKDWDYAEDYFHDYLELTGARLLVPDKILDDISTVCREEIRTGRPFKFKR